MRPRVAVADYGAGNLHSVRRALEKAGAEPVLTSDPAALRAADGVVLPGVGSARAAMKRLESLGLAAELREQAERGKPLLGVCLGMQLLYGANEEGPTVGLGLLPGRVERLRGRSKVPHMGWNSLEHTRPSPLLADVAEGSYVYFVHSYHVLPDDRADVLATCDYEGEVVAVVGRGQVLGTQFHPEKSGDTGLRMYRSFVELVSG